MDQIAEGQMGNITNKYARCLMLFAYRGSISTDRVVTIEL